MHRNLDIRVAQFCLLFEKRKKKESKLIALSKKGRDTFFIIPVKFSKHFSLLFFLFSFPLLLLLSYQTFNRKHGSVKENVSRVKPTPSFFTFLIHILNRRSFFPQEKDLLSGMREDGGKKIDVVNYINHRGKGVFSFLSLFQEARSSMNAL